MFLGSFPIIYLEFRGKLWKLWVKKIIELKKVDYMGSCWRNISGGSKSGDEQNNEFFPWNYLNKMHRLVQLNIWISKRKLGSICTISNKKILKSF